jgi:hypothetical protein
MSEMNTHYSHKQIEQFCQRHEVRRLALFGSTVKGKAHPDSDVDILIAFKPEAHVGFLALGRMQRELEIIFNRPVDLVPQDGLKPVIRESILGESRELYAC